MDISTTTVKYCLENANVKDEGLKNRVANTYKFSKHDSSKFILLLQKGTYSCKYMDDWEKLNKRHYQRKEKFTVT